MKLATTLEGSVVSRKELEIGQFLFTQTGGVDAMWRLSKFAIPCSLATRVNSRVNPKLMRSIRVWQWRWLDSKENLLEKTGRTLQKRMAMWEKEKITRVFRRKFSVNYRTSWKIYLILPGKTQPFLWRVLKWISSFAVAKTTVFSKRSRRWRSFPPDGMYMIEQLTRCIRHWTLTWHMRQKIPAILMQTKGYSHLWADFLVPGSPRDS